jgi:hypothetical protein
MSNPPPVSFGKHFAQETIAGSIEPPNAPGDDCTAELAVKLAEADATIARLRAALIERVVLEEFDYPGDAPESCGFECHLCNVGGAKTAAEVQHKPDCPLAAGN